MFLKKDNISLECMKKVKSLLSTHLFVIFFHDYARVVTTKTESI